VENFGKPKLFICGRPPFPLGYPRNVSDPETSTTLFFLLFSRRRTINIVRRLYKKAGTLHAKTNGHTLSNRYYPITLYIHGHTLRKILCDATECPEYIPRYIVSSFVCVHADKSRESQRT